MPSWLLDLISFVDHLPAWARFLALFLSTALEYLFPIFPGDTIVIAAGLFDTQTNLNPGEIFLAIALGTLIGSASTYYLGRSLAQQRFRFRWTDRLIASPNFKLFKAWYSRWGYGLLLVNRFFPGVRSGFFIAAGLSRLAILPTLGAALVSGLVFNGGLYSLGFLVGHNLESFSLVLRQYNMMVYCSLVVIGLLVLIWWLKK